MELGEATRADPGCTEAILLGAELDVQSGAPSCPRSKP